MDRRFEMAKAVVSGMLANPRNEESFPSSLMVRNVDAILAELDRTAPKPNIHSDVLNDHPRPWKQEKRDIFDAKGEMVCGSFVSSAHAKAVIDGLGMGE